MIKTIINKNILLARLVCNENFCHYLPGDKKPKGCFILNYKTTLIDLYHFMYHWRDYKVLIKDILDNPECNGTATNGDHQLEKGPNDTVYLYDGLDKELDAMIDERLATDDPDAEIYDVLDDSNSIRLTQENFIDCLKQWDWVEKNKPKYVLFWRKKIGSDVNIETFENGDDVNTRIEELEKVIEK